MVEIFFIFSIGLLGASVRWNKTRNASLQNNSISIPENLLLPYSPIIFLPGKKSIFYFLNYWNSIPTFLQDIGLPAVELSLPWRRKSLRIQSLKTHIESFQRLNIRAHLVFDKSSLHEVRDLLSSPLIANIASCTLCLEEELTTTELRPLQIPIVEIITPPSKGPFFWQLHKFFTGDKDISSSAIGLSNGTNQSQLIQQLLQRFKFLAEIETTHQGPHHDRQHQIRPD